MPCREQKYISQIREQMSGPDLHVFTLEFFALKKLFFICFWVKNSKNMYKEGIMQLFIANVIVFSDN